MTKIIQNLVLEGEYQKIGSKIINRANQLALHILKRKSPTITKPPYYLYTNELGKQGYISSLYPLGGGFDTDIHSTYLLEYKGVVYKYTEKTEIVTIEKNQNQKLTF